MLKCRRLIRVVYLKLQNKQSRMEIKVETMKIASSGPNKMNDPTEIFLALLMMKKIFDFVGI